MKTPRNMRVVEGETAVEIHWKWSPLFGDPHNWLPLAFGLLWLYGTLGMLLIWGVATQNGLLFFLALGLLLLAAYFQLARFVNRTIIRVDRDAIRVRHAPLPYPGGKRIPLAGLNNDGLTVERRRVYRQGRHVGSDFAVQAERKGSAPVVLLKGIPDRDHAQFIAGRINRFRTLQ
ncbi:MAG: hypothetical protein KC425_06930 [Anaerolineales bacterium]|nr:hypothetical protein [Anaerolineales bacterium]